MSNRFQNKTILVTGGTTGIGLATARAFASEGARVVATGTNPETIARARAELGESVRVVRSDAGSRSDLEHLVEILGGTRIDAMFLNAGINHVGSIADTDDAMLDEIFRVNFKGPWFALKLLSPHLADRANIVVTTSVNALVAMPGIAAYSASKAALRMLVRLAATELAPRGIRVNAVCPGPIDTPLYAKLGLDERNTREMRAGRIAAIPLHRFGDPAEIAKAVLFLASEASFATGAELVLDGGMTLV